MKSKIEKLNLKSQKQFELIDITAKVEQVVSGAGVGSGHVNVFSPHTTAAVRLNHNEPLLLQDLMKMLYRLIPIDENYSHDLFEIRSGVETSQRSNGHAHVKAFLLGSSQTIPISQSKMMLGGKQSIFFVELDGGRDREVIVEVTGE